MVPPQTVAEHAGADEATAKCGLGHKAHNVLLVHRDTKATPVARVNQENEGKRDAEDHKDVQDAVVVMDTTERKALCMTAQTDFKATLVRKGVMDTAVNEEIEDVAAHKVHAVLDPKDLLAIR